jgi:hypothetical protein
MNNHSNLSDHEAISKAHDILQKAIMEGGKKSKLLDYLRENHNSDYKALISDCKTHGPGLRKAIRDFVGDSAQTIPHETVSSGRTILDVIEKLPKDILVEKSNIGWWVSGIATAAGISAYLINEYGKTPSKAPALPPGDWQERTQQPNAAEVRTR